MNKTMAAYLRRSQMLLELARNRKGESRIRWRSAELGSWESVHPRWWVVGGKIRLQFHSQGRTLAVWVSSIQPRPWGLKILLLSPRNPIPEVLEVVWQEDLLKTFVLSGELWRVVHCWIGHRFPGSQIVCASRRPNLARTLSGSFLRVFLRHRGRDCLIIVATTAPSDQAHLALSQALLWLSHLATSKQLSGIPLICLLVPSGSSAVLFHRCQFLNRERIKTEVWQYEEGSKLPREIRRAPPPLPPVENRDFRWPVLGPFRWSPQLERVLNLAPDYIRRYPRFQDYDSLRLWGLEFAHAAGPERDRICFGVGASRIELAEDNFKGICSLVEEILFYRRPDCPDTQHPYYRLQAERWLEALILEDIPSLFPEVAAESVYPQIPVYLGRDPGRIDILGADRRGTLVVMELKVSTDADLPVQALDYWGRVIQHNQNGDFEHRGYFSGIRLNRARPKIYLVSPVFSFHDSTEQILRFLDPDLEVWKIAINEDWRCGVRILQRIHIRCGDLK